MLKVQKTATAASEKGTAIQRQLDRRIMNMILGLELRCFAFEFPRTFASEPVEMRIEHWTVQPNWETGEFSGNRLRLIELRVLPQGDPTNVLIASKSPALGRPTLRPHIVIAFQDVLASGVLSKDMSLKTISEHVREQLSKMNVGSEVTENKPNFETIRRVISPLWSDHNKQ